MINEFGERLNSARKLAGMSMETLALKAGGVVSKQAISKYENGKINPGSEVLLALANALNVKVDYFFRSSQVAISGIEFRKRSRLTKKAEEQITFQTIDFIQRYLEIEDILDVRPKFSNPVTHNHIRTSGDIERAAGEIREKWHLGNGPIPHLIELLEDQGCKIIEVDADEKFDGLSGFVEDSPIPVIAVLKKQDLVRKRFTIAHELGHLLLDFSDTNDRSSEKQCHSFAGALLLPKAVIKEELGKKRDKITVWELKKLKGIYGVSIQAIMARAHHLGIISDNTWRQFNIQLNKRGWRKSEPGSYEGFERANRFKQLVMHAAAEQIVSFSKAAELLHQSLAEFEKECQIVS
jgi:Zn-dependent peptidase ImmA (M78 family)/DNA-binding XRE family transcriptional regulator